MARREPPEKGARFLIDRNRLYFSKIKTNMNMKTHLLLGCLLYAVTLQAQLKTTPRCPDVSVDILDGTVNTILLPTSTVGQIRLNLPCYTSSQEESDTAKCGGGVFYRDKDLYFFTARDYIEIGPHFRGKLSIPLLGTPRSGLFHWLGKPQVRDVNWDAFSTAYGILILYYNAAGKVDRIQMSTQSASTIRLCDQAPQ